jgi:hypothetical protein
MFISVFLSRVCLQESLRSQIEKMLQTDKVLLPGTTYSRDEANRAVAAFYNRHE